MLIIVVDNNSLEIVSQYQDTGPNPPKFANGWENPSKFSHFGLSSGDYTCYDISKVGGVVHCDLNQTKLDTWKRAQNLEAKNEYKKMRDAECDDLINNTILYPNQDVTWLMFAADQLFIWLDALQTAAGIADGSLSSDGQTAKATLVDLRTNLLAAVQAARDQRDADEAAFTPPYTDVSPLYPA